MSGIRPATDAGAARWLLGPGVDWWDLVRYGPPVFDAYARVAFERGPDDGADDGASDGASGGEPPAFDAVRAALAALSAHTAATGGYAAVWEGWGGVPAPRAPRVEIPHRPMLLFTGPLEALRDAPALGWYGSAESVQQEPHLVWPDDRAWCLACEVDEEVEFTVGCSADVLAALQRELPVTVRPVRYGDQAPLYREAPGHHA